MRPSPVVPPSTNAAADPFAGGALLDSAPTSDAQREILAVARLGDDANLAYNEGTLLSLNGPVDRARLVGALTALHRRHEALRSTFSRDDEVFFVWDRPLALERRTVSVDAGGAPRYDLAARALVSEPFDLDEGPLFRAVLLEPPAPRADGAELLLLAHHLVCDGWSLGVLVDELIALYRGFASALGPAPRIVEYAARARVPDPATDAYWQRQFEGSVPRMELPASARRGAVREYRSARVDVPVDADVIAGVRRFASQQQVTFFAALFAGAAATVGRLCGEDDVVLAVPSAGQAGAGVPGLVGHCVNVLPVRLYVDPHEPVSGLVRRAGARLLDAQEHQDFTIGRLMRTVAIPRVPGRVPVTPVMFNLDQGLPLDKLLDGTGITGAARTIPRAAEYFELFLNLVQHEGRSVVIECQYDATLFTDALVREWLDGFVALLAAMSADRARQCGTLDVFSPGSLARLDGEWQGPALREPAPATVHEWIGRTARAHGDAIAVLDGSVSMSYRELVDRSAQLSHLLRAIGAGPGQRVAISVSRTAMLPVAILGVLGSGAMYVPLDLEYPADRVRFMLEDSAPVAWVVDGDLPPGLEAGESQLLDLRTIDWAADTEVDFPPVAMDGARHPAYMIHTSGSTGRPKGVLVPHAAVTNLLAAMTDALAVDGTDRVLAITTLSFDIAALELLLPLTLGATSCIVDGETARDPRRLAAAIESFGVSVMQATPSTWRLLLDDGWTGDRALTALCGGEALPPALAARLLPAVRRLWNVFGPTETTIWSTLHEVTSADTVGEAVPIGRPIAHTHAEIVDARDRRVPIGVTGELLIGGRGVALGYHQRPELTRERFVTLPLAGGARLYRTGDLVLRRTDGALQFVGRSDGQVKIRGFRVELGEIEAVLGETPGVAVAAARAWDDGDGDARLAAYVVPVARATIDGDAVLRRLRGYVPAHMVPQHLIVLDALPTTPNGKLDRQALPRPSAHASTSGPDAPWSETERAVAEVWTEVLGAPVVHRSADFFALGGHSILVVRAISRLEKRLGVTIGLRRLFERSRLDEFAASIPDAGATAAWEEVSL